MCIALFHKQRYVMWKGQNVAYLNVANSSQSLMLRFGEKLQNVEFGKKINKMKNKKCLFSFHYPGDL